MTITRHIQVGAGMTLQIATAIPDRLLGASVAPISGVEAVGERKKGLLRAGKDERDLALF
jgi:hypothetical protein